MPNSTCRNCGGSKIATGGHVRIGEGRFTLCMDKDPSAAVFKGHVNCDAGFSVCGDCGAVQLFAAEPEKLYAAFLIAQQTATQS